MKRTNIKPEDISGIIVSKPNSAEQNLDMDPFSFIVDSSKEHADKVKGSLQGTLLTFGDTVVKFNQMLDQIAEAFTNVDKSLSVSITESKEGAVGRTGASGMSNTYSRASDVK